MLNKLPNLGFSSLTMLDEAGVSSIEQLREMGAVAAYVAVKKSGVKPSQNMLYALEGALSNRHWQDVARDERLVLLAQLEDHERSHLYL